MDSLWTPTVDLIKCLWGPISRQIGYIKDLDHNLDTLKSETDELKSMREGIQNEVDHAVASGKIPAPLVRNWLDVADSCIAQVVSIRSELEGGRSHYYCTHLNSRRKLGKRILRLRNEVQNNKVRGKDLPPQFQKVTMSPRHSQMPDKRDVPPELEEQNSSKEAVEKISQWLKDELVGVICIWGMGGVGKTTLVKQICNKFEETKDFQQVIWVTVSKDYDLEAIQQRIANKLELEFGTNDGIEDKQDKLRSRLNNVRYLLILDDLWQKLSLEHVGIPKPNKENGCKIVITTRKNEVTNKMEADRKIRLQPLGTKEAWQLFCNKTENAITSPEIRPLAEEVLKECGGLPLAIVTVGRAMRHKVTKELWQHALKALKRAIPGISGMEGEVFRLLKLSYDCLEDPQIKSCFLFCALYPEDYEIDETRLVRNWAFGEGLANNAETLDDALNKGHVVLDKLMDVCLLEKQTSWLGRDYIRMHDLVRDLAIWITAPSSPPAAAASGQKFLVKAGVGLEEAPEERLWEGMTKISLMKNRITEIQMMPNCPDLVCLLLSNNHALHTIGDHFFLYMPKLQILDLSYSDIKWLPSSLSLLVNLRVLSVSSCSNLKEVPSLEDLKELELLDLSSSGIENLPLGIANLSKLKYLDIKFMKSLKTIPPNVISRLTFLGDLRLLSRNWKVRVDTWKEVAALPRLTCLEIHLPLSDAFTSDAMNHPIWSRLTRYTVCAAIHQFHIQYSGFAKSVYIDGCEVFRRRIGCIGNAECLKMRDCQGLQRLSQIIGESRTLKYIHLQRQQGLKCVIDWKDVGEDNAILGCLETLNLHQLGSLQKVFDGAPPMTGFGRLRYINISDCPKLTSIFSSIMVQHLYQLDCLVASRCEQLKEIVEGGPFPGTAQLKLMSLTLATLPKLTTICKQRLVLKSLSDIHVSDCPVLKKLPTLCSDNIQKVSGLISGGKEWWEGIVWEDDYSMSLYSTIYEQRVEDIEEYSGEEA